MPAHDELTPNQIEQLGRILQPAFRLAVREELHAIRNDFTAALSTQTSRLEQTMHETTERVQAVEKRVAGLEGFRLKVLLIWGGVVTSAGFVLTLAKDWFFATRAH